MRGTFVDGLEGLHDDQIDWFWGFKLVPDVQMYVHIGRNLLTYTYVHLIQTVTCIMYINLCLSYGVADPGYDNRA